MMPYFNKEKFADILNSKAEMALGTPKQVFFSVAKMVEKLPDADVVEVIAVKALEEDLECVGNELAKVEAERDALLEELQRLADCSSCKFNTPDAVDGCSALMPCKDGSMWEWKGVKNER